MAAFSGITVIKGKPTCSAELMQALIYRDHGDDALRFTESTDTSATLEYRRRSWRRPERYSFTLEMAQKAQLAGSTTWRNYPAALLRARCVSAVARMAFADSIGGLYTPEELGAAVDVQDDQIVVVDAQAGRTVDTATGEVTAGAPPRELPPPPDRPATPKQIAGIERACAVLGLTPPGDWLGRLNFADAQEWIAEHTADVLARQAEQAAAATEPEEMPI